METNRETAPRVLIVDDNPKNIQVLGTILKNNDYLVNVAMDGLQALTVADKTDPDIILLDVMMPNLDGFETCKKLKTQEKTKDIPVIFLTAKTESQDIVTGFEVGAVDYLTKPFNSIELLARVKTHLELKFNREIIEQRNNEYKELLHILCHDLINPFYSLSGFLDLILDDPKKLNEYAEFMKSSIESGLEIIDLVRKMRVLEDKNALEIMTFNLKKMMEESMAMFFQKAGQKNVKIDLDVDESINVKVDRTSFVNSVINNLLSNAIKFSFPDSKIDVKAVKDGQKVNLSIKDHGIGIPEGLLNNLFDVRKTTSRRGTQGETGTGFGMPLVKKFVDAYGGTINVRSRSDKTDLTNHGTEVYLVLEKG